MNVCIHVYTKIWFMLISLFKKKLTIQREEWEVKEIFDDHIDFLKGQEIVKVLYMNTDYDYLKKIEDDLKDITGDLDVSYSSNRYIEFNHQGVNKGQGLKKLADILGVDIKETIAIGDNFNDLSMIKLQDLVLGYKTPLKI